jgi:hypothetical protein
MQLVCKTIKATILVGESQFSAYPHTSKLFYCKKKDNDIWLSFETLLFNLFFFLRKIWIDINIIFFSGILSHKIEVNRARIHFETTGDGPNILLLLPGSLGICLVLKLIHAIDKCSRGLKFNI